ncbi:MAG: substrate-binding domain-containing protein, partial [Firmicutes bacterium]|nr:substrate-binding domain-containing protein [Bacillota bacterium]
RLANPAITTVNVHIYELGETAARLLLEQFTDVPTEPRHVIVAHELVVRRTCGAWEAPDMRVEATDSVPARASDNA